HALVRRREPTLHPRGRCRRGGRRRPSRPRPLRSLDSGRSPLSNGAMRLDHAIVDTPVGALEMFANDRALCGLGFVDGRDGLRRFLERRFGDVELREALDPAGLATALRAYFAGAVDAIDSMVVDTGGTDF